MKLTKPDVHITTDNTDHITDARIDPALAVVARGTLAYPTNRVLDGSSDHGWAEEWTEAATLPDGRECYRVYLFDTADLAAADGNPENYPWGDDHVRRIVLADN